jgi:hypothetical protein
MIASGNDDESTEIENLQGNFLLAADQDICVFPPQMHK